MDERAHLDRRSLRVPPCALLPEVLVETLIYYEAWFF